jgi:hypothetical protein
MHVGGYERSALRGNVAQSAYQLGVSDIVLGCGLANPPCIRVQDIQRRRTGSEIDIIVREIVSFVAQNVEEFEGARSRLKCPIDDFIREKDMVLLLVYVGPMILQQVQDIFVVDLHAQLAQDLPRF